VKVQRNIIYITVAGSIGSVLIYAYCVFCWNPCPNSICFKLNTYISNLIIGVWGSSIISLLIGIASYGENRRRDLEAFIFAQQDLFKHCAKYKEDNSAEWFDKYVELYRNLSNSWANIHFIFDPMKHRVFLEEYVDYFGDFIQLTQDKYYLLKQDIDESSKKTLREEIDLIVFNRRTLDRGVMQIHTEENKLTHNMEMPIKYIDDIYRNRNVLKKFVFEQTLLSEKNFVVLNKKYEDYLRMICKELHKSNCTEIDYAMPKEDAEYLMKVGYLSGFTHGQGNITSKIKIRFIAVHYFDMKKRLATKK
jgi:hypothetical protein